MMEDYLNKGRSLNLEGLANASVKVTVGFKCEGQVKVLLAREAHQAAMTLSEYVEYIVSLRHNQRQSVTNEITQELEQSKSSVQRLQHQLAVYEQNEFLQSLLAVNLGKSVNWRDAAGKEHTLTIKHVSDVFQVMVSSFKKE